MAKTDHRLKLYREFVELFENWKFIQELQQTLSIWRCVKNGIKSQKERAGY